MKLKPLFFILTIFLILSGCGNPLIRDILQPKAGADIVINSAAVTVIGPVTGAEPNDIVQEYGTGYTCGPVTWVPNHSSFRGGMNYTATVTLTAENGYTFTGLTTATVNGNSAGITIINRTTVTLSYTFAATSENAVTGISITTQPVLEYTHGGTLNLSGLEVMLIYDDDTTETVVLDDFSGYYISTNPPDGATLSHSEHDGNPVVVSVNGLSANTDNLTVNKATPTAGDYKITNLDQTAGSVTPVSITPKEGKSSGTISIYYNGSTTLPTTVGEYPVTFTVAEAEDNNWNTASGLSAGTLIINNIPAIDSVTELAAYLTDLSANDVTDPYNITLNASDLTDIAEALIAAPDIYVILDLSGSKINKIGESAFINCANLIGITIPDSVTSIESLSFYNCTSLTGIDIPNNVESIGKSAFSGCTSLTSIDIPNSVESIGESAFSGCTSLTSIDIPNSVESIGESAFFDCHSLTSVTIPNSVTSIKNNIFNNCTGLMSIDVVNGNTAYSSDSGVLYNKEKTFLIAYPAGKTESSFIIPDSVTSMEDYAFRGCTSLENVTIPDGITDIANWAFIECNNLTSVKFEGMIDIFGINAFPGDLANKYSGPNGGPGTYTTANPGNNAVWTKEP